ncbi:hypothetical protein [Tumebacillus flagellatus]|uniref:Uncharacterized protein n=1 Tax=Tumebacillus flagellatus TaxID=1157490 RepID=A0A074LRJ9_9BACL|nr:hypothetical protein [Tumebacillus flagellatus]KEO84761.1 hypothetical protein EL26_01760 [Tumebacillus flagellatus]
MSFKDFLQSDLQNVFLNPDEFGETHKIDGAEVICIVDSDSLSSQPVHEGVYLAVVRLFVEKRLLKEKVPKKYAIGSRLNLDGQMYYVSNLANNVGMLEFTLEANES